MTDPKMEKNDLRTQFLAELHESLENPLHKRIVLAYSREEQPLNSMIAELSKAFLEVLRHED